MNAVKSHVFHLQRLPPPRDLLSLLSPAYQSDGCIARMDVSLCFMEWITRSSKPSKGWLHSRLLCYEDFTQTRVWVSSRKLSKRYLHCTANRFEIGVAPSSRFPFCCAPQKWVLGALQTLHVFSLLACCPSPSRHTKEGIRPSNS